MHTVASGWNFINIRHDEVLQFCERVYNHSKYGYKNVNCLQLNDSKQTDKLK
jgi:hypothetical protein